MMKSNSRSLVRLAQKEMMFEVEVYLPLHQEREQLEFEVWDCREEEEE